MGSGGGNSAGWGAMVVEGPLAARGPEESAVLGIGRRLMR